MPHTPTPRDSTNQKGFTLVELAVTLTIVGLLLGAVLKGRELVENARVTSTVQQVRDYKAALNTFNNIYAALPGDMVNPATRLSDCVSATCMTSGDGNRFISPLVGSPSLSITISFLVTLPETRQFWLHMQKAGLISGVDPNGVSASPMMFGREIPESPMRTGGFFAYTLQPGAQYPSMKAMAIGIGTPEYINPIRASSAEQMDQKMDDGKPFTGNVLSDPACGTNLTATALYPAVSSSIRCDVSFLMGF